MSRRLVSQNPLEAYGAWIAGVDGEWPQEAAHSVRREFIDTVAVMVPGAAESATQKAFEVVKNWGEGPCAAVGQLQRLSAPWAALVNGTAGHALDFDDNFDPPKAHASAVLVPAILALGEESGASGVSRFARVGQGPPARSLGRSRTLPIPLLSHPGGRVSGYDTFALGTD